MPITGRLLRLAGRIFHHQNRRDIMVIIGSKLVMPTVSPHIRVLIIGLSGAPLILATPMWRASTVRSAAVLDRSIRPTGGSPRRLVTRWGRMVLLGFKSSSLVRAVIFSPFTNRIIFPPVWGWTPGFLIR